MQSKLLKLLSCLGNNTTDGISNEMLFWMYFAHICIDLSRMKVMIQ